MHFSCQVSHTFAGFKILLSHKSKFLFRSDYGRRGATYSIRAFWARPTKSPPYADSPQVNHYIIPSLRFSNISVRARYYTEHNTPTGDYCIMLHMVIYCVTTHPKTPLPLRAYVYGFIHNVDRTIRFSVKYMGFPTYLQRLTASVRHIYPITGLSFHLATKAGQVPRFQPKPTTWGLLEEVDLHYRRLRRATILTVLPICLHLPLLIVSPLVSSKLSWRRWICTHRSPRKDTSSTNLMPICLHRYC